MSLPVRCQPILPMRKLSRYLRHALCRPPWRVSIWRYDPAVPPPRLHTVLLMFGLGLALAGCDPTAAKNLQFVAQETTNQDFLAAESITVGNRPITLIGADLDNDLVWKQPDDELLVPGSFRVFPFDVANAHLEEAQIDVKGRDVTARLVVEPRNPKFQPEELAALVVFETKTKDKENTRYAFNVRGVGN